MFSVATFVNPELQLTVDRNTTKIAVFESTLTEALNLASLQRWRPHENNFWYIFAKSDASFTCCPLHLDILVLNEKFKIFPRQTKRRTNQSKTQILRRILEIQVSRIPTRSQFSKNYVLKILLFKKK